MECMIVCIWMNDSSTCYVINELYLSSSDGLWAISNNRAQTGRNSFKDRVINQFSYSRITVLWTAKNPNAPPRIWIVKSKSLNSYAISLSNSDINHLYSIDLIKMLKIRIFIIENTIFLCITPLYAQLPPSLSLSSRFFQVGEFFSNGIYESKQTAQA